MFEYRQSFYSQKHSAKERGIKFLLTYSQWYKIWADSGKLSQRGRKKGQYCMARFGDVGPYVIGNVEIILVSKNVHDGSVGKVISDGHKEAIKQANNKRFESEEARQLISMSNSKRGISEETKLKIATSLSGRKLSSEHKANIAKSRNRQ